MKKTEDFTLSFLTAFGIHLVLLTAAALAGYSVTMLVPQQAEEIKEAIRIAPEDNIVPAAENSGMPEDDINELPEVPNDLWDEMDVETPPKPNFDLIDPTASKPPEDLTKNNMYGKELEASSTRRRYGRINEGGAFGKKFGFNGTGYGKNFYGKPADGKVLFLFDVSSSMSNSFSSLKEEMIRTIENLDISDQFDCVAYSTAFYRTKDGLVDAFATSVLWGKIKTANIENKDLAIKWLNNIKTSGGTPSYEALKYVCDNYPLDLDKLFFITDGFPSMNSNGTPEDFKEWWKKFKNCKLICVSIGDNSLFIRQIANAVGGSHIVVKE